MRCSDNIKRSSALCLVCEAWDGFAVDEIARVEECNPFVTNTHDEGALSCEQ